MRCYRCGEHQGDLGLAVLVKEGRLKKMTGSLPRKSDSWHFDAKYRAGRSSGTWCRSATWPSGVPAAGAGIGVFFTHTSYGTMLRVGQDVHSCPGGLGVQGDHPGDTPLTVGPAEPSAGSTSCPATRVSSASASVTSAETSLSLASRPSQATSGSPVRV